MASDDVAGENYKAKKRAKAAAIAVDDRPPIERLYSAWSDLKAQGWTEINYAPKDAEIEIIEPGSTGIFRARWHSFGHKPLDSCGCWFAEDGGDLWPSRPILWRIPKKQIRPHGDSPTPAGQDAGTSRKESGCADSAHSPAKGDSREGGGAENPSPISRSDGQG